MKKSKLKRLIEYCPKPPEPLTTTLKRYSIPTAIISLSIVLVISLFLLFPGALTQPTSPQTIPPPPLPELPTLQSDYYPGVSVGNYVTYGNFVCKICPQENAGCINNLAFWKVEVIEVSGTEVTFLHTQQYKNGTATPFTGCTETVDVEQAWWSDDTEYCIDYSLIIAANLTEGSCIHLGECDFPGHTVIGIEKRTYFGVSRDVIPLRYPNTMVDGFNVTYNFVYDRESGIKLENKLISSDGDVVRAMSLIETNIFSIKGGEND